MADLKSTVNPLFLREEELRRGMEFLFYAYRDFTGEPDEILAGYGLGRAHHRVVYFVGRYPGITVSRLLSILKITKQSLSRVMTELVEQGLIEARPGPSDRRQRLLNLTDKGWALERELSGVQMRRVARAYRDAGAEAVEGFRRVMLGVMNPDDRSRFADAEPAPRRSTGR